MNAFREINSLKLPVFLFLTICFISTGITYSDSNDVTISADLSTYEFDTDQSHVTQTGGFAGVHEIYPIEGYFQLCVNFDEEEAFFEQVDANLLEPTGFLPTESLDELFNMTELTGILLDDTTVVFVGKAEDAPGTDTYIVVIVNLTDDMAYIYGQTIPPVCCDFFYFDINAVAKRKYSGGTGDPNNPYQIATAEDLITLGETPVDYDKNFILIADIDLDPNLPGRKVFDRAVIAPDVNDAEDGIRGIPFTGYFDGDNHSISHLTIIGKGRLGLFGHTGAGVWISNLGLEAVDVIGEVDVGGLVGCMDNPAEYGDGCGVESVILNCYSTGSITGQRDVGGLLGSNLCGTINSCYSTGSVNGVECVGGLVGWHYGPMTSSYSTSSVNGEECVGGLVGWQYGSTIMLSYSTGSVSGGEEIGGFVGENNGSINSCYSTGSVTGGEEIGGFVGKNNGSINACYSIGSVNGNNMVGGLVGSNGIFADIFKGSITLSFWDTQTSDLLNMCGSQAEGATGCDDSFGKTTVEMQTESTFTDEGWDFIGETVNGPNDIWKMWDSYDYPRLTCEPGPNTPLVFVDVNDPNFYGQMSKYEVTNDQYCDFLKEALASGDITINDTIVEGADGSNCGEDYLGQSYYKLDGLGWTGAGATSGSASRIHYNEGEFNVDDGFGNHPVTYVSWYGAMAFANYYGYYLPTEDQWQAVADYDGTYIYGCGQIIDPGIANYRDSENPDGTTSVGSYGQYGYDMSDMAGNVWEWTSSDSENSRIFCGGSWSSYDSDCDVSIRGEGIPYANYYDVGFRVCR